MSNDLNRHVVYSLIDYFNGYCFCLCLVLQIHRSRKALKQDPKCHYVRVISTLLELLQRCFTKLRLVKQQRCHFNINN